jgi:hypothetical protein
MAESMTGNQKVKKIQNAAQITKMKRLLFKGFEPKTNFIAKPTYPQKKTSTNFKELLSSKRAGVAMKKNGLNHKLIILKRNYLRKK